MNVQRQIDRLIAYQASQWYERLKHPDAECHHRFIRWVSESPRHMDAFLAISSEAAMLRLVSSSAEFQLGNLLKQVSEDSSIVPLGPCSLHPQAPLDRYMLLRKTRTWWAAAAALAIAAIALPLWISQFAGQRFETPTGEQRTIQLAEGSIVNLNTQSRVDVKYSAANREIHLRRGEASFKVAHDPARPFRVWTPDAVVEATGTQFNVHVNDDETTTVSVLEGRVRISPLGTRPTKQTKKVDVIAGEEAKVQASGDVDLHANANVAEAIAWQQRKLIFKHASLPEIAAEFNRYNQSAQIRLEGLEPGAFYFSGTLNADDPYSLATLLTREPDLLVETHDNDIVVRGAGGANKLN